MTIRVAVADDQPLVRTGFATIVDRAPGKALAGEVADEEHAVALAVASSTYAPRREEGGWDDGRSGQPR